MFNGMQNLPDANTLTRNRHGDIMSYYTNDIDTLRQLVSQAHAHAAGRVGHAWWSACWRIMLYYSLWMTLVVLLGVVLMLLVSKKLGGGTRQILHSPAG